MCFKGWLANGSYVILVSFYNFNIEPFSYDTSFMILQRKGWSIKAIEVQTVQWNERSTIHSFQSF